MSDSRAAVGHDRLPWLTDEPQRAKERRPDLFGWAVAATVLVAGVSYWMGMQSAVEPPAFTFEREQPGTTVPLPQAKPAEPAKPEIDPVAAPEVPPVAAPPMPAIERPAPTVEPARAAPAKRTVAKPRPRAKPKASAKKKASARKKAAAAKSDAPQLWPARVVEGAHGRMVRIGTFTTRRQAKKGWWAVMRAYPGMQRLPAVVVPAQSLRNGRVYYRLQMGTSSQAHSAVLCQRMRLIGQSCVVIGLPA